MHMTGGETFTRTKEVTGCFVSVGKRQVSTIMSTGTGPRFRRHWEHSRMGISKIN